MDDKREQINQAKQFLNENGYLVLKISKGLIKTALECDLDQFDEVNCETNCVGCFNKTCLKTIIKNQLLGMKL